MTEKQLILSKEQIAARVAELGRQITRDYADKELVLIGILNGAFIFMADLTRAIDLPHELDFIRVASYGACSVSSGAITFTKDIELSVAGKHVLLVEDIVDTGRTMQCLIDHLKSKGPASLKLCALIDKQERREVKLQVDYSGFAIQHGFLVGYGLDYAEQHRYYPEIFHLVNPEK